MGGVIFAKTNVPQSLFAYACDNLIFGKTLNPKNLKLSPGGSSGGSGAILGGGGVVFATGICNFVLAKIIKCTNDLFYLRI